MTEYYRLYTKSFPTERVLNACVHVAYTNQNNGHKKQTYFMILRNASFFLGTMHDACLGNPESKREMIAQTEESCSRMLLISSVAWLPTKCRRPSFSCYLTYS